MQWISKVKNRRHSDRADAILVMSILFVPFLFLVSGFAMDLTKSVYVKQQYQSMAQDASSSAARTININGSIASTAPQELVNVYKDRFSGYDTSSVNSGNTNNKASQEGSFGVRNSQCRTVTLPDGSVKTAPYMIITLSGGRNDLDAVNGTSFSPVYTSDPAVSGGAPILRTGTTYNNAVRYTTIEAQVWDTSPNLMLGMFGRPCQQLKTEVSAITFGSQSDLRGFGPDATRQQTRTNEVNTPSFESGLGGWHFNSAFGNFATGGTMATSTDRAWVGSRSLKVTIPAASQQSGSYEFVGGLTPGATYTLSMYIYVPSGNPDVRIDALFARGGTVSAVKNQWVRHSVTWTEGGDGRFIGVNGAANQAGTFYVDGILLEKTSNSTAYFDGGFPDASLKNYNWVGGAHTSKSTEVIDY